METLNWLVVYPEALLLTMACIIALIDLFDDSPQRATTYWLTQATLASFAVLHGHRLAGGENVIALQGLVVADPMGHLLACCAAIAMIVTLVYARPYAASRELLRGEFFVLALFVMLGIAVMVSANNFLVIYLGLELMSLSLYALTALRRDNGPATEAAMKYFVLGALASGFLLYGLSMMYGATGSLDLPEVFSFIATGNPNKQVLAIGTVFVVAGLAFKLGAVPFHMWVPDVYQGAPTGVTLLIAGAPKLAAFAITIRLLVEGMSGLAQSWQQMLILLAVGSLIIGNLVAIAQTNLKRMLAYSTIGQIGFVLLGLSSGVVHGNTLSAGNSYASSMFYMITYVLTTLGTFGMIMVLARQGFEAEQIDDFKGLAKRSPWMGGVMAVFMFSLAGIPPTVGFYAKLSVLQALVATYDSTYITLAVVAVLLSLVGAFYYLRLVKVMYFDDPTDTTPIRAGGDVQAVLALNGFAVLAFGILPGSLMSLCVQAIVDALAS